MGSDLYTTLRHGSPLRWLYLLSPVAIAGFIAACSADGNNADATGVGGAGTPTGEVCGDGVEGCSCSSEGLRAECGKFFERNGDQTTCNYGTSTCTNGAWSDCRDTSIRVGRASGLKLLACANPCSPGCMTETDNATSVDAAGGGIVVIDGGATLYNGPPPINMCRWIMVTPPSTTITVTSGTFTGTPPRLAASSFSASVRPASCYPLPTVTPIWAIDRYDVAQMDTDGTLRIIAPVPGPIDVSAIFGTLTPGTAVANVVVNITENATGPSAPPGGVTSGSFPPVTGLEPVDTHTILYPYDGTVFPLSLKAPLLQWSNGGIPATAAKVTLQYPAATGALFKYAMLITESITAPVPLRAAQPRYQIPADVQFAFEQAVQKNRATNGDTARIEVQRLRGGIAYQPTSIDIRFASGQLRGDVYYNSYGTSLASFYPGARREAGGAFVGGNFGASTLRIPVGADAPVIAAGTTDCRVCHAVNSQATILLTANSGHSYFRYPIPIVGGPTLVGNAIYTFPALTPAGDKLLTGSNGIDPGATEAVSRLRPSIGGGPIAGATAFTNLRAGMPAFSHDAQAVAFLFGGGGTAPVANPATGPTTGDRKTLTVMSFNNATNQFSNARNLYTPADPTGTCGGNDSTDATLAATCGSSTTGVGRSVWPGFLPPGQGGPSGGVVFELETRQGSGGVGYTRNDGDSTDRRMDRGATGELWWATVPTAGGAQASRLDRANGWAADGITSAIPTTPSGAIRSAGYGGCAGCPSNSALRHNARGTGTEAVWYEQVYNYEPSALPTTYGGYSWVIFTSRRMYGNVATINPYWSDPRFRDISIEPTTKKLWMTAVSNNPAGGTDPSSPAFYVPGQEYESGNSKGVFVEAACGVSGATCNSDLDCCSTPNALSCVLDPPPLANPPQKHCVNLGFPCRSTGQTCTLTSQCCLAASDGEFCGNGVCSQRPPYYQTADIMRQYDSACPAGKRPRWSLFEWQSITPSTMTGGPSRIDFYVQTRETAAQPWGNAILYATAQGASILDPAWGRGAQSMDQALLADNQVSKSSILVTMRLHANSDNTIAPTVVNWRATVDCVDNQ